MVSPGFRPERAPGGSRTPPEPTKVIEKFVHGLSPSYTVAECSTKSQANVAENYKSVFARFGDVNIRTGREMEDQHTAWYLGMAFPYTMPLAVGGYDVPDAPRWRRPESSNLPTPRALLKDWLVPAVSLAQRKTNSQHFAMGPSATVK